MDIVTTVNIKNNLLDKMINTKQELNISLNKIVSLLLYKASNSRRKLKAVLDFRPKRG